MSKTDITVRTRSDGKLVRTRPDGSEEVLEIRPPTRMTSDEIEANARRDPDNPPVTGAGLQRMRRVPRVKEIRRSLSLTQEEFATRFQIPLGTLRDWEQGRTEPDQPARAYLEAIARDPEIIAPAADRRTDVRQAGVAVRDIRDITVRGTTTGQVRSHAGRDLAGVRLLNGEIRYVPVTQLEPLPKQESRIDAFIAQRTGGPNELSRHLLGEKISGHLTNVYYSMETGKADFYAHQFRPVLKFVESTIGRILVADEVGLGKTISAIYIWKELQARAGARRLLVVCPSALREKWQDELRNRFSVEARIVDAAELLEQLESTHRDTGRGFVLIGSLEGLRSRRRTDAGSSRRQRLMQWLLENQSSSEFAALDLVIIDEAHAARNPKTANHHFAEALRDAAAHLVLLTATPVQTHSENLFNLLRLVDPDRFVSADTFEQARRANISVIGAVNALLSAPADLDAYQHHLERATIEPLFQNDRYLIELGREQRTEWDQHQKVHVARMLESRSLLADVMVRTRKREAFQNRVQRVPWMLEVTLSLPEQQLYSRLSTRIRASANRKYTDTPTAFILIGRQRQLASSIPAALISWSKTQYFQELLWDDLGIDLDTSETEGSAIPIEDLLRDYDFEAGDTKYLAFSRGLKERLRTNPAEKIIVFAFFRGTLAYLKRRLEADGIHCAFIHGSMGETSIGAEQVDAKTAEIARFAAPNGPSILLSSEVGSEGIDLQFARILFNYDLPWNPMRVEQRIGRIDRLGQKADRITIGHFATTGTIDDDIISRLYQRINVFRESIGDLDEIFGERIQSIILDYFRENLSPEDVQRRIEQNVVAAESNKLEIERLDREAPALAGHADYILRSISQSHASGRYVRPDDLRRYVTDFLHEKYPGSAVEYDVASSGPFRIDPSAGARDKLAAFIEEERPARHTRLAGGAIVATFDPGVPAVGRLRPELVDITHPLVLWIRSVKAAETSDLIPAVACELDATRIDVPPGLYVFVSDFWRMEGVRKQLTIEYVALSVETGARMERPLVERLIDSVVQHGKDVDLFEFAEGRQTLVNALQSCEKLMEDEYLSELAAFETENTNRVAQARQLVDARAQRKMFQLQAVLDQLTRSQDERQRRVVPLTEARIRRVREERDQQVARIDRQGRVEASFRPIVGGLIVVRSKANDEGLDKAT
jgi:DNA-binding transcriptional regulator YiaG/superfamily II DNA or RNA helicase